MTSVANALLAPTDWDDYLRRQAFTAAHAELRDREAARTQLLDYIRYFYEGDDLVADAFMQRVCDEIMQFLDSVLAGNDPCLIIEAPPRHGKSLICSENLPSFCMGYLHAHGINRPQVLHVGYSQTFIEEFGRKTRDRMSDPRYENVFPACIPRADGASVSDVHTISGGRYHAGGMGAAITGLGGHVIILDDPVKGCEQANSETEMRKHHEWYQSVLATRAMDRCGKLMILTRWSMADVAGFVQEVAAAQPEADQWRVLKFPAIALENDILGRAVGEPLCPKRFPLSRLRKERAGKTAKVWSAMYQQNPVPETGGTFSLEEVEACMVKPSDIPPPDQLAMYLAGDFAIGDKALNDWTVLWPFGVDSRGHVWFMPTPSRFKRDGTTHTIDELLRLAKKYRIKKMILEDGHIYRGFQDQLKLAMQNSGRYYSIDAPYPTANKTARAEPLTVMIEHGTVHFPNNSFFRDVVIPEMLAFGVDSVGVHDDTVDAMATAVMKMSKLSKGKGIPDKPLPAEAVDWEHPTMAQMKKMSQARHSRRRAGKAGNPFIKPLLRLNGRPFGGTKQS